METSKSSESRRSMSEEGRTSPRSHRDTACRVTKSGRNFWLLYKLRTPCYAQARTTKREKERKNGLQRYLDQTS